LQSTKVTLLSFLGSIATLLACLAALNVVVIRMTRNSVPKQVLARSATAADRHIVALGNSLVAAGFDEIAFDTGMQQAPRTGALNLGLGSSTPVEHLLLLRAALRTMTDPKIIVYGFYDLQLTEPVILSMNELFGNHAMLYFVEPEFAEKFFHQSLHDRVAFELVRYIPMIVERGAIWAKVERFRRVLAEQGLSKQATNRFGNVRDFSLLEEQQVAFLNDCARSSSEALNDPIDEIIREVSSRGIKTVVVEMPMHPFHVDAYYRSAEWILYREHLRRLLAARKVRFVDASDWITSEQEFADHLHLSPEGAAEFSERLGMQLRGW
jgi:hypothetical protein